MRARTRHTRSAVVDSDDSQSESDGSEARENGFFDDEALESAGSTEELSGSDEEEVDPFPFTRLPPELRLRVWTLFCPDLLGAPRVLDFNVHDSLSPTRTAPCKVIGAGMCLEEQTRALRCVLATNQQSRSIAKDKFPEELFLESDDGNIFSLRVNLKSDVCMLDHVPDFAHSELMLGLSITNRVNLDGFSQSIVKLALPLHDVNLYEQNTDVTSWLRKFRSLQHIFLYTDDDSFGGRRLKDDAVRWCASHHARQYYMETFEQEPGYGEDYTKLVCWPDFEKSPNFTEAHVPKWHTKFLHQAQEYAFKDAGVKLHPMVIFQTELGLERFDHFVATDYLPAKVYGANEEGSDVESYEEDPDEDFEVDETSGLVDTYESDGIDDEEPEVFHESGDEHLDDGDSDDGGGYGGAVAQPLSSPEQSENEGGPSVRGRKRRVVADSDDEDDGPGSRPVKRKRIHVIEDSDEEHGHAEAAEPQVISSDEDEVPTKRQRVEVVDSDEEREDGSEDNGQPQRITLADRLQIRNKRVLPEEDSEEEDEQEEDEDEDEDDDDDEDEDGLIDNMAAESDEDEGEDEDEDEDEDEGEEDE